MPVENVLPRSVISLRISNGGILTLSFVKFVSYRIFIKRISSHHLFDYSGYNLYRKRTKELNFFPFTSLKNN